jgi:hypothetical protein
MGIFLAPTQPVLVALGTENRVCYPGNTADRQPKWALRYCYLSQSAASLNKKWTLPLLGLDSATFGTLSHCSDHTAKSLPIDTVKI